ncbi:MAG: hypothetical protein K5637_00210 [Lachnospiraceae bacterium]|nr:hypothetical protein [Lachnospiraceae bacterium]
MREKLERFMSGRYGNDPFNHFLLVAALILLVIQLITRSGFLYVIALIVLIFAYYRMLSRNHAKRYQELQKFEAVRDRVVGIFRRDSSGNSEYHIYRCQSCGQKIRVPRGKGRIRITCPKCGNQFIKRS